MNKVALLYDSLFSLNSKRKNGDSYPIHKSLNYLDSTVDNLYDYLLKNYYFPDEGNLLDCGCGVGYGSLLFASQFENLSVKGISLSSKEIALANKNCVDKNLTKNCDFEVCSFDDLPSNKYDCVVAIESLKHSADVKNTMGVLVRSLRNNGRLIIIEDVVKAPLSNFASRRQCNDWELQRLYESGDYLNESGLVSKETRNMSEHLTLPSVLSIIMRIAFSEILVGLSRIGIRKISSSKIMRGGFYQELLYKTGKLDYLIMTAKKES